MLTTCLILCQSLSLFWPKVTTLQKQLSSTQRDLASAREEVQVKMSQAKQNKKQFDIQEAKVCQFTYISNNFNNNY